MLPALFVSHGAPSLPLENGPARDFLVQLGQSLPRPEVILAVSTHWDTPAPSLSVATKNSTIHDFYGFPQPLYDLRYEAPGAPDAGEEIAALLQQGGLPAPNKVERGLDHGAWVPLLLMYPEADIPVLQLSIQSGAGVAHHIALGEALRPFRQRGLILASGGLVHNLRELNWQGGPEPAWSEAFADWIDGAVRERRRDDLIAYRSKAPGALRAHPSEDHILPLFVAYGAGDCAHRLHRSASYGSLRMDAYAFD